MFKLCFYISVLFVISIWTCFAFALLITCSHVFLVPEPCFELFQGFSYKSLKTTNVQNAKFVFCWKCLFSNILGKRGQNKHCLFSIFRGQWLLKTLYCLFNEISKLLSQIRPEMTLNIAFKNLFIRCFSIFSCYLHEGGKPWILGSLDTWILDFECCLPKTGTNQISVCPNKNWGNFGAKFSFLYFGFPRKVGSISNRT